MGFEPDEDEDDLSAFLAVVAQIDAEPDMDPWDVAERRRREAGR